MMTLRKSLFSTTATAIAVTALLMGGCNSKDKSEDAQISVAAAPLGLKANDKKDFKQYFEVAPRTTTESEAQTALKSLSLAEEGKMTWANKSGENGNYVYKNLGVKNDDSTLLIGQAQIFGVHMEGDEATFDRADFQDLKITGDDVVMNIGSMSLARPSPKMAQTILGAIQNAEGTDNIKLDIEDGEVLTLGAISMNDITLTAEQATGTVDHIIWGSDENTNLGDGKVGKIDFTIKGDDEMVSVLKFEGGSARGVNMEPYKNMSRDMNGMGLGQTMGLGQMLGQMNLFAKPYDEFTIGKGLFSNDVFSFDFEGFEGQAKESGGVTKITQIGKPMTFSFLKEPKTLQGKQAYTMLKNLGFDTMSFTTSQTQVMDKNKDTVAIENGLLEMKDSFKLNYTYEAEGLSAMVDAAKAAETKYATDGSGSDRDADVLMESLEALKVRAMKISLEDNSILERGLKLASEMTGQSEEMLKRQLKVAVMAAPLMAQSELEKELLGQTGDAFAKFVESGGTFTVAMKPSEPVSIMDLAQAREKNLNPKSLGFSAGVSE